MGCDRISGRWFPPRPGELKLNFDGVIFEEEGCSSIGIVIRDGEGKFLLGFCKKIIRLHREESVKPMAASVVATLAMEENLQKVILEGDSKAVIEVVCSRNIRMSSFGHFLDQILLCEQQFCGFLASWVHRDGSLNACGLAKHVVNCFDFIV